MDLKIVLLIGLVVGAIAAAFLLWPTPPPSPVPKAEIEVIEAAGAWCAGLRGSPRLDVATSSVVTRIRVDHGATAGLATPLRTGTEIADAAPRILVGHGATASRVVVGPEGEPLAGSSARILVGYAATSSLIGPMGESSDLQSDGARVETRLFIENAEVARVQTLDPVPREEDGP